MLQRCKRVTIFLWKFSHNLCSLEAEGQAQGKKKKIKLLFYGNVKFITCKLFEFHGESSKGMKYAFIPPALYWTRSHVHFFLNRTVSDLGCLEHVKTSQISTALMYSRSTINVFSLQDVSEIRSDIEIPMISGQNLVHVKNDDPRSLTPNPTKPV